MESALTVKTKTGSLPPDKKARAEARALLQRVERMNYFADW
jgi:hypothetical protein